MRLRIQDVYCICAKTQLHISQPTMLDLPDMDQGPDVYETSDVESEEQLPVPEKESQDIDANHLATDEAKKLFEKDVIVESLTLVDFLGTSAGTSGYSIKRMDETTEQKLARIAFELEEIRSHEPNKLSHVDSLSVLLENLVEEKSGGLYGEKLRAVFARIDPTEDLDTIEKEQRENKEAKEGKGETGPSEVLQLEKRLFSLEEVVGVSDLVTSKSLRNHVNDMMRRIDVLYDLEFEMGHLKAEIRKLNKDLETLTTNRRLAHLTQGEAAPTKPFEAKIDSLHEKLPDFERANLVVPKLISRLRSLHQVHTEMAHSVSAVIEIDKTIHDLSEEMRKWDTALGEVNAALDKHSEAFEDNRKVVERKLEVIERKLQN